MNYNYTLSCYETVLYCYDQEGKKISRCLFFFKKDPEALVVEDFRINGRLFCKVVLNNHGYIFYRATYTRLCNAYIRLKRKLHEC